MARVAKTGGPMDKIIVPKGPVPDIFPLEEEARNGI